MQKLTIFPAEIVDFEVWMGQATLAQRNLSSPAFVREMILVANAGFHSCECPTFDATCPAMDLPMDGEKAIQADLLNDADKAHRAIQAHFLRAIRLERADQSRGLFA